MSRGFFSVYVASMKIDSNENISSGDSESFSCVLIIYWRHAYEWSASSPARNSLCEQMVEGGCCWVNDSQSFLILVAAGQSEYSSICRSDADTHCPL